MASSKVVPFALAAAFIALFASATLNRYSVGTSPVEDARSLVDKALRRDSSALRGLASQPDVRRWLVRAQHTDAIALAAWVDWPAFGTWLRHGAPVEVTLRRLDVIDRRWLSPQSVSYGGE